MRLAVHSHVCSRGWTYGGHGHQGVPAAAVRWEGLFVWAWEGLFCAGMGGPRCHGVGGLPLALLALCIGAHLSTAKSSLCNMRALILHPMVLTHY